MRRDMEPRPPSASEVVAAELMMPHQVNNHGHVFGGVILSIVDRVAGVVSMRHAGVPCVTVSFDRVDFKEPIFTGEVVTVKAQVNFVGTTSMEIGVRVEAENPFTREARHTNSCYLTFVAFDADHRPVPVPPLKLETEEDERRFHEGQRRRASRIALARELEDT